MDQPSVTEPKPPALPTSPTPSPWQTNNEETSTVVDVEPGEPGTTTGNATIVAPEAAPAWALALADQLSAVTGLLEGIKATLEDQAGKISSLAATVGQLENMDPSEIMGQVGAMFGLKP
jgi:hypothetical protein